MTTSTTSRANIPVVIGGVRFPRARYDEEGDLLYLTKGIPLGPADGDTREGHPVFLGQDGRVIGVLIMGDETDSELRLWLGSPPG